MAANKRESWEIERDREEIATLLARHRRIRHQQLADILNGRRRDEHKAATQEAADAGGLVAVVDPPYTLTRQMVDYEVKALKKEWRNRAAEKFESMVDAQLNEIDELAHAAWEGYERSMRAHDSITKFTSSTTVDATALDETTETIKHLKIPAVRTNETRKRTTLVGDPRFLEVVGKQVQHRNELLGLVDDELRISVQPTDIKLVAGFDPAAWDHPKENHEPPETAAAETVPQQP